MIQVHVQWLVLLAGCIQLIEVDAITPAADVPLKVCSIQFSFSVECDCVVLLFRPMWPRFTARLLSDIMAKHSGF
eukprot:m.527636 g.527636  ORF g.527636 m.527636 type:complete len:75 (-) comp22012_c0_seq6:113-337(-)